jgi:hypothetical protein
MDKDPAEIVATLRRSIDASQRGSRRLRAHRFKDLFGFQAWSPARREMVGRLLSDEGIVVQPSLEQAGRDDWLVLSIPTPGVTTGTAPEPRPTADVHDTEKGDPLVLVETKAVGKGPDAGLGQARSYAFWVKPAYYVVTDGDYLTVWNYQGGAVPDVRVCEARRGSLGEKFDDLYAVLNPQAALATRQQKITRLTGPQPTAT